MNVDKVLITEVEEQNDSHDSTPYNQQVPDSNVKVICEDDSELLQTLSRISSADDGSHSLSTANSSSTHGTAPIDAGRLELLHGRETSNYDTDLEIEDEKIDFTLSGQKIYIESCKDLGIVPVSYFLRNLHQSTIEMRHHGLGPNGAKAIAVPLVTNTNVLKLDLEDNWIDGLGATYLADMLKENCYISDLTIAENNIGGQGARAICSMLTQNTTITSINLSGNNFTDSDAPVFASTILENSSVRSLNLSHNKFGEASGILLGHALGENETLESLDLSWNSFRGSGGIALIDGVKVNSRLKKVSIAWNGLGNDCALSIADCLKNNSILLDLDLSNNRISLEGVLLISKGLDANEFLKCLHIGKNPIGSAGSLLLLHALDNDRSILETLDLEDVPVDKEFQNRLNAIRESGRNLEVIYGTVLGDYVIKGTYSKKTGEPTNETNKDLEALENFLNSDPMAKVKVYVEKNNMRLIDFFNQIDKDKNHRVTAEDLKKLFKREGIELSENKIDRWVKSLDKTGTGGIDYSILLKIET